MKRFFLIILFVILGSNCFAALKWLESISVENHTQQDIFIEYELKQGPSLEENNYFFDLPIGNLMFEGHDRFFNHTQSVLSSFKVQRIFEYIFLMTLELFLEKILLMEHLILEHF